MFSKAPVVRFNDRRDDNPPLGSYDPKFITDLAISAANKGHSFVTSDRSSSRSSSRSASPANSTHRSVSHQRCRSACDESTPKSRRNSSQPARRSRPLTATFNFHGRHSPKELADKETATDQEFLEEDKSNLMDDSAAAIKILGLQNSLKEFQAKVLALEEEKFLVNSLQESRAASSSQEKAEWNETQKTLTITIKDLQTALDEMQVIADEYHEKYQPLIEERDMLLKNITEVQEKYEKNLQKTQAVEKELQAKKAQISQADDKCQLLVNSVQETYNICDEKMVKAEAKEKQWKQRENELLASIDILKGDNKSLQVRLDGEKTLRNQVESQTKMQVESNAALKLTMDDKIRALTSQWLDKENEYLKKIAEMSQIRNSADQHAEKYSNRVRQLVREIKDTRDGNNNYQSKIKNMLNLKVSGESEEPASESSSLSSVSVPGENGSKSELGKSASQTDDEITFDNSTDFKEPLRKKIDEIKLLQQESVKRREMYNKKIEETVTWISEIEEENNRHREQIEICAAALNPEEEALKTPFTTKEIQSLRSQLLESVPFNDQAIKSEFDAVMFPTKPESPRDSQSKLYRQEKMLDFVADMVKESRERLGSLSGTEFLATTPPDSETKIISSVVDETGAAERPQEGGNKRSYFGGICCNTLAAVEEESDVEAVQDPSEPEK